MILPIMIVLCGSAALGKPIITVRFSPLFIESTKGWKANEEKYLQTSLNFERQLEVEKKAEYEIETARQRSGYKRCCCKELKEKEQIMETASCFCHRVFFKYIHWLKEQWTSVEARKEELETLIKNVQAVLKVVEDTYQHEKAEWKLNNSQETGKNEDYEVIDKGILELEQETSEWQKILTELENKLNSLRTNEQQTQIVQPTFNWNSN